MLTSNSVEGGSPPGNISEDNGDLYMDIFGPWFITCMGENTLVVCLFSTFFLSPLLYQQWNREIC